MPYRPTPTHTLAAALRKLAREIRTDDGVANACLEEAALRLEQQSEQLRDLTEARRGWTEPGKN